MGLAFGCKDCESVFVLFSIRDLEEIPFLQAVEVERQISRRVDTRILEEIVHHTGGAVFDALDVSQIVDRTEHLVGFSVQCTILKERSEC